MRTSQHTNKRNELVESVANAKLVIKGSFFHLKDKNLEWVEFVGMGFIVLQRATRGNYKKEKRSHLLNIFSHQSQPATTEVAPKKD